MNTPWKFTLAERGVEDRRWLLSFDSVKVGDPVWGKHVGVILPDPISKEAVLAVGAILEADLNRKRA